MKKNQHYHWPKPDNPKEWNPQTKNLIPFISCTCRLKMEKNNTHQQDENPNIKTKTPSPPPVQKANDSGFKHMVLISWWHSSYWQALLCTNPETNVLQKHITAMKAFGQAFHTPLVSSCCHQRNFEMPADCVIVIHLGHWTGCQMHSGCHYSVGHIQVIKGDQY